LKSEQEMLTPVIKTIMPEIQVLALDELATDNENEKNSVAAMNSIDYREKCARALLSTRLQMELRQRQRTLSNVKEENTVVVNNNDDAEQESMPLQVSSDANARALLAATLLYAAKDRAMKVTLERQRKEEMFHRARLATQFSYIATPDSDNLKQEETIALNAPSDANARALLAATLHYAAKDRVMKATLERQRKEEMFQRARLATQLSYNGTSKKDKNETTTLFSIKRTAEDEEALAKRYGSLEIGDRAFQILKDLGLIGNYDFDDE
jgi:hypothetical protein